MAREAHRLIAAKGKKVTTLDLQTAPPADDILAGLMLGPTGNLRAPIMRVGQTILVGYNDQAFADIFG
jgi:arsenate reductase-like glutaredoxin family protein